MKINSSGYLSIGIKFKLSEAGKVASLCEKLGVNADKETIHYIDDQMYMDISKRIGDRDAISEQEAVCIWRDFGIVEGKINETTHND